MNTTTTKTQEKDPIKKAGPAMGWIGTLFFIVLDIGYSLPLLFSPLYAEI